MPPPMLSPPPLATALFFPRRELEAPTIRRYACKCSFAKALPCHVMATFRSLCAPKSMSSRLGAGPPGVVFIPTRRTKITRDGIGTSTSSAAHFIVVTWISSRLRQPAKSLPFAQCGMTMSLAVLISSRSPQYPSTCVAVWPGQTSLKDYGACKRWAPPVPW